MAYTGLSITALAAGTRLFVETNLLHTMPVSVPGVTLLIVGALSIWVGQRRPEKHGFVYAGLVLIVFGIIGVALPVAMGIDHF